jgi:hypothetical protein
MLPAAYTQPDEQVVDEEKVQSVGGAIGSWSQVAF